MSTQVSSFTIDVEDWFHILDCDAAPAMSTHGGQLRGLIRHVRLFGFKGTLVLTSRLLAAKTRDCFNGKSTTSHFHSIRSVAQAFDIPYYEINRVEGL